MQFRVLSGYSQDDFAKKLLISRISQSNIERTDSLSKISNDLLFRIYYILSKGENDEEEYITGLREDLLSSVEKEINNRTNDKYFSITKKKIYTPQNSD